MHVVGVDIGGSHMGLCLMRDDTLLDTKDFTFASGTGTSSPEAIIDLIITQALQWNKEYCKGDAICAVGVGCPGQSVDGVLVAASNFPQWKQVPFVAMLQKRMPGLHAVLLNDADAAVAAEVWSKQNASMYQGVRHAAMITLGTGVGLGLILNGSIHSGANGLIEGGHMIAQPARDARQCGCGQSGCVEVYASATNAARIWQEHHSGKKEGGAKEMFAAAAAGDVAAIATIDQAAEYISIMCINLCRIVDPEVIILGGGMAKAGGNLLAKVQRQVQQRTWTVLPTSVRLVTASSVEHAGTVGAALAASHSMLNGTVIPTAPVVSRLSWLQYGAEALLFGQILCEKNTLGGIAVFLASALLIRRYLCDKHR